MNHNKGFWHFTRAPFISSMALAGIFSAASAQALTLSVTIDSLGPFQAGDSGIQVSIRADETITVGSTDINLNWDMMGIEANSASSSVLSAFTSNLENDLMRVSTASAAVGGDTISAGDALMTFSFSAIEAGTYNLFITDADGTAPDDLAGPVPPIPPVSIPYDSVSANLEVSAVPVPAALWLFGSGLIGMVGVARKRRNQ
jgi:hypothetical protein